MKLVDLAPVWLTPDMFVFRSPSGRGDLITCKRVPMTHKEQMEVVYIQNPQFKGIPVVLTVADMAWTFTGNDFSTLTVTPSIDASASGNWHGFITNGNIVGGI